MTSFESPSAADSSTAELPVHLTRFIGRDRELDDLARLVGATRMLTLTGAGGSGKTRLAREAALRASASFGHVAWADLAPLTDAQLLPQAVAAALHVAERAGATPLERLVGAVSGERLLLVLDNCEHLVDACAELAEALLRACPGLAILATSREALGVASETAWLVPPLASAEAAQLFVERAQAALPSFELAAGNAAAVAEICRRLDGIPLAIELAAARVRVLSPEQIAARLGDAFRLLTAGSRTALPRHRTLRATMEWSHGMLGAREQVLLRRLAVFHGSFSLDVAEAVCAGGPLGADDILDGVSALVDKSLVAMEAGDGVARYRLLETVRQYAFERLAEAGEAGAYEEAHARHFLAMAAELAPHIVGGTAGAGAMARLGAEQDNLRAAMAFTLRRAEREPEWVAAALRLADHLFWFWYGAGHWLRTQQFAEARRFTAAALRLGADADPLLRARAHMAAGLSSHPQGEYEDARAHFAEARALARAHGDAELAIMAQGKVAAALLMLGEVERAWAESEEAWAAVRPMPPSVLWGFVGVWRTLIALERGELATARECMAQLVRVGHVLDNAVTVAHAHAFLGRVEVLAGNPDEAAAHLQTALHQHLELGDWWGLSNDLEWLSALAATRRRWADSARLAGAVDALRERVGIVLYPVDRPHRERRTAEAQAKLGDAYARHYAEGRTLPREALVTIATDDSLHSTAEHHVPMPAAPAADPAGRAALRVLALGPLQVFVGGRLVEGAAWGSARPRELLVYLLMHPEGRTKEQAGLAFWPDASTAQLRNSFHVTLHRLRKALGSAELVTLVGDRYRVDPDAVEEFDVADFERDVAAARRAVKRQQEGAAEQLEGALARFRGDFLDGEPVGDWHLEHRDRLQRVYVDALMELGARLAQEERHGRAADAYRRVLARDELHEEALLALMRCHAALGERSQALRAYRRFAERLRAELGAEPRGEATRLFERLQQGGGGAEARAGGAPSRR